MHRIRSIVVVVAVLALGGATVAFAGSGGSSGGGGPDRGDDHRGGDRDDRWRGRVAHATLVDASGDRVGRVWMREDRRDDVVYIEARVEDLPPGFHGFHIHTTGRCEPPFTSAGGHYNPTGASHGDHAGDLPSLLVNDDGSALLVTATDRFSLSDLREGDGSAVMVHSGRDNFANIPARYGTPDAETLSTGDAGSRIACGVVR